MEYFIKLEYIDLNTTFNCGQCFRWEQIQQDSDTFTGYAGNKSVTVRQGENGITLLDVNEVDIPFWERYFCADEDYSSLIERFCADSTLKLACEFAPGIRVLRQEPFETLISFIISQNNHIKRITGIIKDMCRQFGGNGFPTPADIAALSEGDLTQLGAGYRARYILDAAKKVNFGEIKLDEIEKMPYTVAKGELLKIIGVGEKVADCVLLFGFHKTEAFPRDVWIKRLIAEYYPDKLPDCIKGYEGIAQQFLFHYVRNNNK